MNHVADVLFSTPEMTATFSSEAHVGGMLRFEAALAQAEDSAGVIPAPAAAAITAACRIELFDVTALYQEAASAGTVAIPLVRLLSEQVADDGGKYVHWGATSQDAVDSAMMLQMRAGLDLLAASLLEACAACADLAQAQRGTLMAGRTLLQQALPITFGLKAARWLALLTRQVRSLREQRERAIALQFGGAAGTLAALGDKGLIVAELLARELALPLPDLPWHAERDRVAGIGAALGVTAGAAAKIAGDIVLLAQSEVGEVAEGAAPGKGASSAMPQKRNPVDATMALAAARQAIGLVPVLLNAMEQEHERGVGGWQLEWATIPALFKTTAAAVTRTGTALRGLEVDPRRMRANMERDGGLLMAEALTMALAPHLGRPAAQTLVGEIGKQVSATGSTLGAIALADERVRAHLSAAAIESALEPANYLGSSAVFIDRALQFYRATAAL